MEEARLNITHRKPMLVLDDRFSFLKDLEVGKKIQLEANITIDAMDTDYDEDGQSVRIIEFLVNKAEIAGGKLI